MSAWQRMLAKLKSIRETVFMSIFIPAIYITTFPMYGTISAANQLAADIFILNFFLADHVFFFVDSDQEVGEF